MQGGLTCKGQGLGNWKAGHKEFRLAIDFKQSHALMP